MGCDIHMHVEVCKEGQWVNYDYRGKYKIGQHEDGSDKMDYERLFDDPLYLGRNYNLFAILAGVRNGDGREYEPISEPRGLPKDAAKETREDSDSWGVDGHSHSWLLLQELTDHTWQKKTSSHSGWVSPAEFLEWEKVGQPLSWCQGVGGGSVRHVSNDQMRDLLKTGQAKAEQRFGSESLSFYTHVGWTQPYGESVKGFVKETLPALQALGKPKDVRIVFWFDN